MPSTGAADYAFCESKYMAAARLRLSLFGKARFQTMADDPTTHARDSSRSDEMPDEWTAMMAGDDSPIVRNARVVRIDNESVWFDVGCKLESTIALSKWGSDEEPPSIGDKFPIMIDDDRDVDDRPLKIIRVDIRRIPRIPVWESVIANIELGQIHSGRISRKIDGGFLVDIGVNTFLPDARATPAMITDADTFVGRDVTCRITSVDHDRRSIEVSLE